jgi:hypothetical protein
MDYRDEPLYGKTSLKFLQSSPNMPEFSPVAVLLVVAVPSDQPD